MAGPPCRCSNCAFVFETPLIEVAPGIIIQGCAVECPRCGGPAVIGDGTYSNVRDELRLDAGPLSTRAMIDELNRIAKKAREKNFTAEEVLAEIADVSPELATKLKGLGPWPVVGIMLLLFWLVKSVNLDLRVDVNWLIDQAWHIAHGEDPDSHLDSPPPQFPEQSSPAQPKPMPLDPPVLAAPIVPNRRARRRESSKAKRIASRTTSKEGT